MLLRNVFERCPSEEPYCLDETDHRTSRMLEDPFTLDKDPYGALESSRALGALDDPAMQEVPQLVYWSMKDCGRLHAESFSLGFWVEIGVRCRQRLHEVGQLMTQQAGRTLDVLKVFGMFGWG